MKYTFFIYIFGLFFTLGSGAVFADTESVVNEVHIKTNTGGNTVSPGGKVTNGSASATVSITTEINGEVTSNIHIATSSNSRIDIHVSNGRNGANGADGKSGTNGTNGSAGVDGVDGKSGASSISGTTHRGASSSTATTTASGVEDVETPIPIEAVAERSLGKTVSAYISQVFQTVTGYFSKLFTRN